MEYATQDLDLRIALYQRIAKWAECPVVVNAKDLTILQRRMTRITLVSNKSSAAPPSLTAFSHRCSNRAAGEARAALTFE